MNMKKSFSFGLFFFLFYVVSFAGELTAPEAKNYFNEAVKAQKISDFEMSETNYRKALLVDPYNLDLQKFILNNRGMMYLKLGDMDRAEESFKAALRLDPKYQAAYINYSLISERHRSRLQSLEYWLKYFKINLEAMKPKEYILQEEQ